MGLKPKTNPIGPVDPALAKLGFTRLKRDVRKWLSMEVSGPTKVGKTNFELTMTEPIGVLNTDRALEDALANHPNVDVIVKDFSRKISPGEPLNQAQAKLLEAEFQAAYRALGEHKLIKSVGVDKWTTIWEVARYAEFGVASLKAHHYVPVNLRMRGYLAGADQFHKNVLFIQDTKEEWIAEKPTGRMVIDGFKYTPGLVQVNAVMSRDDDGDFIMRITGCGTNADLVGETFVNEAVDWHKVAPMAVPESNPSDWK